MRRKRFADVGDVKRHEGMEEKDFLRSAVDIGNNRISKFQVNGEYFEKD